MYENDPPVQATKENQSERKKPVSFVELKQYINSLEIDRRPSVELLIDEVFEAVKTAMPYDLNWVDDYEKGSLNEDALDGRVDTNKAALTNYLHKSGGKGVCRQQALLASLIIEKLIDTGIFPQGTRVQFGSNIAYKNNERFGHAWAAVSTQDSKAGRERKFVLDAARHLAGELITDGTGGSVNGKMCNTGKMGDTWSDRKLWPYDVFNRADAPSYLKGHYTGITEMKGKAFLESQKERHLITRNTRIDKGYKWSATGEVAVVADWEKHYEHGYRQIEEDLSGSIYKKLSSRGVKGRFGSIAQRLFGRGAQQPARQEKTPDSFDAVKLKISLAQSFDELCSALQNAPDIQGTQEVFPREELIRRIREVQLGLRGKNFITGTFGLRDKVEELLAKQK